VHGFPIHILVHHQTGETSEQLRIENTCHSIEKAKGKDASNIHAPHSMSTHISNN
jgi:hypothetical protein